MATVEQIQQLLVTKTKTYNNGLKAVAEQQRLIDGLTRQSKALDDQAKKDKQKASKDAAAKADQALKGRS